MSDPTTPASQPLQFDRAIRADAVASAVPGVACARCQRTLADTYFAIGRHAVCEACKLTLERDAGQKLAGAIFGKAFVFGLGAAIAGAVLYVAVGIAIGGEIGLVAIAVGYMIGYSIRKAAGGGGRRYQLLAAGLTYWAVGLARALMAGNRAGIDLPAVVSLLEKSLVLPIVMTLRYMPVSLIGGLIIAVGMAQAWRMTAGADLTFVGPLRVGTTPPATA